MSERHLHAYAIETETLISLFNLESPPELASFLREHAERFPPGLLKHVIAKVAGGETGSDDFASRFAAWGLVSGAATRHEMVELIDLDDVAEILADAHPAIASAFTALHDGMAEPFPVPLGDAPLPALQWLKPDDAASWAAFRDGLQDQADWTDELEDGPEDLAVLADAVVATGEAGQSVILVFEGDL